MLELRNVNTFYGNIQALRDVNIRINEGEIVTLIGANGAGKSTTLMTICGGTPPRSGEVLFRGHPIHTLRPNKIVALGISQVPEGRLIFPDLTVQENLDLGAFLRNDKDNIKKDLDYIFDLFTDVRNSSTELLMAGKGAESLVEKAFDTTVTDGMAVLPGVISRKKQMVPVLINAIKQERG